MGDHRAYGPVLCLLLVIVYGEVLVRTRDGRAASTAAVASYPRTFFAAFNAMRISAPVDITYINGGRVPANANDVSEEMDEDIKAPARDARFPGSDSDGDDDTRNTGNTIEDLTSMNTTGSTRSRHSMVELAAIERIAPDETDPESSAREAAAPEAAAPGVAPVAHRLKATGLPNICIDRLGYNSARDASCYRAMERAFWEDLRAAGPRGPFCWGTPAGRNNGRNNGGRREQTRRGRNLPPLLFHAAVVSRRDAPPALTLLILSFLATQCCDATLMLWTDRDDDGAATLRAQVDLRVPRSISGSRVLWVAAAIQQEYAAVKVDFAKQRSKGDAANAEPVNATFDVVAERMRVRVMTTA